MYNILLIEDDRPLNKAISVYFKKEKFYVLSSFSGQEALDILFQNNLDLIILDINLPDLSGFDLIEQIKIIPKNLANYYKKYKKQKKTISTIKI